MLGHGVELVQVAVGVNVAEAGAGGVVDKEQVGKLVPGAIVDLELVALADAVGPNLHEGAVLGAAAGPAVDPDDGALLVGNVGILEVPEEEVGVVLFVDLDVAAILSATVIFPQATPSLPPLVPSLLTQRAS